MQQLQRSIPDVLTLVWAVPAVGFLVFWTLERCYSYFFQSLDQLTARHDVSFLPQYQNGTIWMEASQALKGVFSAFYERDVRYYTIRIHIVASTIIAFIVAYNLWTGTQLVEARQNTGKPHPGAVNHKMLGWIMVYASIGNLLTTGYTLFVMGMVDVGLSGFLTDMCAWFIMTLTLPLGIYNARHERWKEHRIYMILHAGALLFIPLQRFFWMVGTQWLYVAEDYDSNVAQFFGWLSLTFWVALFISLGTAAIYASIDSLGTMEETGNAAKKSK